MTYPRIQNGWVDSGQPVRGGQKRCPNCHSENFRETLSREICYSCGLECDYWGAGANEIYQAMSERHHEKLRRLQEERWAKESGYDLEDE